MKVTAEFCISHGDTMEQYGIAAHIDPGNGPGEIAWAYREMGDTLTDIVKAGQAHGLLSESAHLVTHPEDR